LNKLLLLFLLLPFYSRAQDTLHFSQLPPDPLAIKIASFYRTFSSPLPSQDIALKFGDSLLLHRYYKQYYLVTDTSKVKPVWFSILMGYDGANFWMAADTDFDGNYEDEQLKKVKLPEGILNATTGEKFHGDISRYDLDSFHLIGTQRHPGFPIFLQPVFSFSSSERGVDQIVMNTVLVSGHKAIGKIILQDQELNIAIQLYPLMADFSLFEFYNTKFQQMCWINVLDSDKERIDSLIAYKNAFSFLVKKEPIAIESFKTYVLPEQIDYLNKTVSIRFRPMEHTMMEDRLKACKVSSAINLSSNEAFKLPAPDSIVLYFTGSWCVPCREMTPKVEVMFNHLPQGWKGFVVANEKSIEDAKRYLSGYKFENMLFESLTEKSECSLKRILEIGLYPSFIYLSPEGKLLGSGITSINDKVSFIIPSLQ
jgi:hypothetical protein